MQRYAGSDPLSRQRSVAQLPATAGSRRCSTIAEYAELIALRIGQHHPRHFALPDVNTGCAECNESLDLGVLIVRLEVEMKAVLDLFAFVDRHEDESRDRSGCGRISNSPGSSLTTIHRRAPSHQ